MTSLVMAGYQCPLHYGVNTDRTGIPMNLSTPGAVQDCCWLRESAMNRISSTLLGANLNSGGKFHEVLVKWPIHK